MSDHHLSALPAFAAATEIQRAAFFAGEEVFLFNDPFFSTKLAPSRDGAQHVFPGFRYWEGFDGSAGEVGTLMTAFNALSRSAALDGAGAAEPVRRGRKTAVTGYFLRCVPVSRGEFDLQCRIILLVGIIDAAYTAI